ncbi:MAG TPA: helix-turn-helix transcriptional regulator [Bacillales bacterium]|nr:helix-turn-helix transcriptional regulator [Bacillales bacterium]
MLENLSELRKKRKWSQQETADQLGIAKSTYAGYESGYREPSLQSLSQIADLFETTVDFILGRTNEEQDQIEVTNLLKYPDSRLLLDGKPLSEDEIVDFVAFVRSKRMLRADVSKPSIDTRE